MLWAVAHDKGYAASHWMTFKQALALGGCVRKGEKSARSVFYGTYERETEAGTGETQKTTSRFAKVNFVFNAEQIDGLPQQYYVEREPTKDLGTRAIPELDGFFADTGATIKTSTKARACFDPINDTVEMPPIETFETASQFYGVLGHETSHWAMAERRLGLQKTFETKAEYAFSELVAELSACFLAVQLGVEPHFDQSAAYIEGWAKALKADKDAIFQAAADAQKTVDYINQIVGGNRGVKAAA